MKTPTQEELNTAIRLVFDAIEKNPPGDYPEEAAHLVRNTARRGRLALELLVKAHDAMTLVIGKDARWQVVNEIEALIGLPEGRDEPDEEAADSQA